jgi:hypothetical protein
MAKKAKSKTRANSRNDRGNTNKTKGTPPQRNKGASRGERRESKYQRDEYDNTNRGVLFDNNRARKDTDPDYTGKVNVNGIEYWLSAWWNESRQGMEFLSLSVREMDYQESERDNQRGSRRNDDRRGSRGSRGKARGREREDEDDDLPF